MMYFLVSIVVLSILLFFPISRLIWVLSVRRLQRKLSRELEGQEIQGQLNRARFIGAFVSLVFSFLFNASLMGIPTHG